MKDQRLSETMDTHGHRIERFTGDHLRITRTDGSTPTPNELHIVEAWYWNFVARRGNDPAPKDSAK